MEKLDFLSTIFPGLKFKDAVYTEKDNTCMANFLYNPDSFKPTQENRKIILDKLIEIIGNFVNIDVNFIACPLDKHAIANHTYSTIINTFPAISKNFTYDDVSVEIENINVKLKLKLSPSIYEYAVGLSRQNLVAEKLKESFLADFTVEFEKKEDVVSSNNTSYIEKNMELMSSIKEAEEKTIYTLSEVDNIIGSNDYTIATDFTKIKSPIENVVICGEITNVSKRTYNRKYTKNGESKEIEKLFYSFTLKLENRFLYCSIFPKQADEAKGDLIEEGMSVCCFGSFREFNGKLNFTANTIARCKFAKEEIKSGFKHVNEEYHTVFPEKYFDYEQGGLFDEDKVFPGSYVVFDLETTGLEPTKDEIIEIGACKIVNGRIDETFSTFVKPSKHIPREVITLTGITDAMVEEAPTINYVLPDFYKFCYNCTMVAHNAQFDMGFIYSASKKLSYNFSNQVMDTLEMSHQKLPGLKNYKLGTIVDKLNITLDNAHRAINDATATAKVFIKLM